MSSIEPINEAQQATHAGGIVYRQEAGRRLFLLVTSSTDASRWVLPKGRIEAGETPEDAAIREVAEEAGMIARPLRTLGQATYVKRQEAVRVQYFLMEWVQDGAPSTEGRQLAWLPYEEALARLSFEDAGRLLRECRA